MLKVGKLYTAATGDRFLVHAKKRKPSSNGCDFIGEHWKNGLITYFNHMGKNSFREDWQLEVDSFKWCGVYADGKLSGQGFIPKEELLEVFPGYLRIDSDNPSTIIFMTRAGLEATYV